MTNSILSFVDRQGWDREPLFEFSDLPREFLRDSSSWLDAKDVEIFLENVERHFGNKISDSSIIEATGHLCHELRAWGVLDSVLRMMQKPQEVYSQPHRFISYFVSPAPPMGNFSKTEDAISFELPISNREFPFFTEYLRAAFEALPKYLGQEMALARWNQTHIEVTWSDAQKSILGGDEERRNFNPELMQTLVSSLESAQRELEEKKKELVLKNLEIKKLTTRGEPGTNLRDDRPLRTRVKDEDLEFSMGELKNHILRLNEYLGRAQQLVTLLVGQDRMNPQVKEAMRRVDWNFVIDNYSEFADEAIHHLMIIQDMLRESSQSGKTKSAESHQTQWTI